MERGVPHDEREVRGLETKGKMTVKLIGDPKIHIYNVGSTEKPKHHRAGEQITVDRETGELFIKNGVAKEVKDNK